MNHRISFHHIYALVFIGAILGCMAPSDTYTQDDGTVVTRRQTLGTDYCPQRLPQAQARLEELYQRLGTTSRQEAVTTSIQGPYGKKIEVSVSSNEQGVIMLDSVATGLSDLVFNCGADFSGHECFVDIFLDGTKLASLSPTTEGRVPFRCLVAGRHQLRIESVGRVIYDGIIDLRSDHEHLVEIRKTEGQDDARFKVYATNPIADRVPPIPTAANTVSTTRTNTTAVDVSRGRASVSTTTTETTTTTTTDASVRTGTTTTTVQGRAMSDGDFSRLLSIVKKAGFDKDRILAIRAAAARSYFTSTQVESLVRAMSFGEGRVEVGVMCYPRIVDKGNFATVLNAYSFGSNRKKVMQRLGL